MDLTSLLYIIIPLIALFIVVKIFKGIIKFIIMAVVILGGFWLYSKYGFKLPI